MRFTGTCHNWCMAAIGTLVTFLLYSGVVFYVVIIADSLHWILVTVHSWTQLHETELVKFLISVRGRDRSNDGSENRIIEQARKHYTLPHTHTILIMLHTTIYVFTYKHYVIGKDWTTNVVLITH
jgi:hypothetical protein